MSAEQDRLNLMALVLRWLAWVELAAVSLMLIAALLISGYSIVFRNLGFSTGDWALTLPEVLLVWMTFIGCGALVTRDEHVTADFLIVALPRKSRAIVRVLVYLVAFVTIIPVLWGSCLIVARMWQVGVKNGQLLDVPQALLYAAVPIGCGLCLLHILGKIAELLTGRAQRRPEE